MEKSRQNLVKLSFQIQSSPLIVWSKLTQSYKRREDVESHGLKEYETQKKSSLGVFPCIYTSIKMQVYLHVYLSVCVQCVTCMFTCLLVCELVFVRSSMCARTQVCVCVYANVLLVCTGLSVSLCSRQIRRELAKGQVDSCSLSSRIATKCCQTHGLHSVIISPAPPDHLTWEATGNGQILQEARGGLTVN